MHAAEERGATGASGDDYLERKAEPLHTSSALMTFLSSASRCILLRASPACLLLCCSCSV